MTKIPHFRVVSLSAAVGLLSGCGGLQSPIGSRGATLQSRAIATPAERGGSWMLPEAKGEDLLYESDTEPPAVYVFSYPGGKRVGTLKGLAGHAQGVCSDRAGDVFVTEFNFASNQIDEYAHGGSSPIRTLNAPGEPVGCAIDPTTGDLAVAIYSYGSGPSSVAIYAAAQGNPTIYADPNLAILSCTYDDSGNIYASGSNSRGFALAELPAGSRKFTDVVLNAKKLDGRFFEPVQWNNGSLAIGVPSGEDPLAYFVLRAAISGTTAKVVGETEVHLRSGNFDVDNAFFIEGTAVAVNSVIDSFDGRVLVWPYPQGGTPLTATPKFGNQYIDGVTVSLVSK